MSQKNHILITGGTGFIGSHVAVALLQSNHKVILYDNLRNSHREVLQNIAMIANRKPIFVCGNLLDTDLLIKTFKKYQITMVIHLAASKSIAESISNPIHYYENNISGTLSLFRAMEACDVKELVFSSSSAVYGEVENCSITEDFFPHPVNPYGQSKFFIEEILKDIVSSLQWNVTVLRYFNVIGAHSSRLLIENPKDKTGNIFLNICDVLQGNKPYLSIYGHDFHTPDGTAIRDYVHVEDVARAHVHVLEWMKNKKSSIEIFNLGSGQGMSVLDVIQIAEQQTQKKIPYHFYPIRTGDVSISYACIQKAKEILNWVPRYHINDAFELIKNC
jgi:UDP-glucose 4-epimerase